MPKFNQKFLRVSFAGHIDIPVADEAHAEEIKAHLEATVAYTVGRAVSEGYVGDYGDGEHTIGDYLDTERAVGADADNPMDGRQDAALNQTMESVFSHARANLWEKELEEVAQ